MRRAGFRVDFGDGMNASYRQGSLLALVWLSFLWRVVAPTPATGMQAPLPDPREFLKDAKENLIGEFTFMITPHHPEDFVWKFEQMINRLDAKERLKKRQYRTWGEVIFLADGRQVNHILGAEPGPIRSEVQDKPIVGFESARNYELGIKVRDEVWEHTRFSLVGRESIDGRPTLVFAFHTEGGMDTSLLRRRIACENTAGRLWFDEEERIPMQVNGERLKDFLSAQKGSKWKARLRKMGRSWLPDYFDHRLRRPYGFLSHGYEQLYGRAFDYAPADRSNRQ